MERADTSVGRNFGLGACLAVALLGGAAAAAPGAPFMGSAAAVPGTANECTAKIDRSNPEGTFALTRSSGANGGCVCVIQTGPEGSQPKALEKQVKAQQQRGDCLDDRAALGGKSDIGSDGYLGDGQPGNSDGTLGGGLLLGVSGLAFNIGAATRNNLPDSPGG